MEQPEELNPYQSPRSAPLSPEQRSHHERLVVLSTFDNSFDAQAFCEELTIHGIDARVVKDQLTGMGATVGGIAFPFPAKVLVLESQKDSAIVVKQRWENSCSDSIHQAPEWTCDCGETVDAGFPACWNCGMGFKGEDRKTV